MVNGVTSQDFYIQKTKDRWWGKQKKNAVVSKFVWKWATHLAKGLQLLQTSFGDLKHEEDIKRQKSSIENWHLCKCYVT